MKKKNNKKWTLVLVLLLVVSIGYAALASNLKINGTTGVKSATWDVYWDNVQINPESVSTTTGNQARITDQKKTQVEYSVTLNEPGDFYEFEVDAVNAGTIDAMIKDNGIITKAYSDANYTTEVTLPDVVRYTVTYADGTAVEPNHLLAKKTGNTPTRETYKVRVEYRNDEEINPSDLDPTNDRQYYLRFQVEYVQADGNAISKPERPVRFVKRQNAGQITPGDIIGIGEAEDFYVISSDDQKTVLLAKYNLKVGLWPDGVGYGVADPTDPGYGLQSMDAEGYDGNSACGTVSFSYTDYWYDNDYDYDGNPYPYVYDNTYVTEPDFDNDGFYTDGYSIAYYVELYKTKLIGIGAPNTITGRLLTYEEAYSAQTIEDNGTSIILDNRQDYWLGSAVSNGDLSVVENGFSFEYYPYNLDSGRYSVRPVIEIPTSELQ